MSQVIYHVEDYLDLMQGEMQYVELRDKWSTYLKSNFNEKIMYMFFWWSLLKLDSKISWWKVSSPF